MNDWVTDQAAIDTLVALKALQEGDEIILKCPRGAGFPKKCYGRVYTIQPHYAEPGDDHALDSDYRLSKYPVVAEIIAGDFESWVLTRHNIKAWRRPCRNG